MPVLSSYDKSNLIYYFVDDRLRYMRFIAPTVICRAVSTTADVEGYRYLLNAFFFKFPDIKYTCYFTRSCMLDASIRLTSSQLQALFSLYKHPGVLLYPPMIFETSDIKYLKKSFLMRDITINNESVPVITNYGFHVLENRLPVSLLEFLLATYDLDMFPYFLVRRLISRLPIAELPRYLVSENKFVRDFAAEKCDQLSKNKVRNF